MPNGLYCLWRVYTFSHNRFFHRSTLKIVCYLLFSISLLLFPYLFWPARLLDFYLLGEKLLLSMNGAKEEITISSLYLCILNIAVSFCAVIWNTTTSYWNLRYLIRLPPIKCIIFGVFLLYLPLLFSSLLFHPFLYLFIVLRLRLIKGESWRQ